VSDESTSGEWYTERLHRRTSARWKKFVPDPYRWNIRHLVLGRVLDIGCGIGRCLSFNDGNGVGIDHNPTSVAMCRERGLEAFTPEDFDQGDHGSFDSILLSHVLEHIEEDEGTALVARYLPFLRDGGRVVIISPQESGQRSDPTHVRFMGTEESSRLLRSLGVADIRTRSHPFPRMVGRVFRYNETVATGTLRRVTSGGD
jgi:2-polyprenyl-3-methyl-5-hydroxy-6-metoxy-1,4-benzoquinol methylase